MTTSDVASLMGVGATSVKRWADAGVLRCVKTAGGHRRFLKSEVDRFLASQKPGAGDLPDPLSPDGWLMTLRDLPDIHMLLGKLLQMRGERGSWASVADGIGGVLARIGQAWREGDITILEEHRASEMLHRALTATAANLPVSPDAPRALLAMAPGDDHSLGLSLVELALREAGWSPIWSGIRTPMDELVSWAESDRVDMLAVSASSWSTDARTLRECALGVKAACDRGNTRLVLGGGGAWPEDLLGVKRISTLDDFSHFLASLAA